MNPGSRGLGGELYNCRGSQGKMGGGIRCVLKEKTDAIISREDSPRFGHVGVILHLRGETERKLVSFFDAAPLKMDGE
jgi:hypothetical protein